MISDWVDVARPWALWLVPGALTLGGAVWWAARRARARLAAYVDHNLMAPLVGQTSRKHLHSAILIGAAAASLVVGLAGLRVGYTHEEVYSTGIDLVIALDVSDSMLVVDGTDGVTRLERARREIRDLLARIDGDRVALVGFAGTAWLACPLTLDTAAASMFLDELDPDLASRQGTALGVALDVSREAFESGARDARAIVLLTDGEDHGGDALEAARKAADEGIHVFAIGIGRDEGSPIPDGDGGFRRDRRGELILSKLDEPTLRSVAEATGGGYVRSTLGDVDLQQVYDLGIKQQTTAEDRAGGRRKIWNDRYAWLVALAMLLLIVERAHAVRKPGES